MTAEDLAAIQRMAPTADRATLGQLLWHVERDLRRLESQWRTYQRRHPGPAFAPTVEQLPFYRVPGEVQLALI